MMDFLTFKSFVSPEALIIIYYIGVLILPGGVWHMTAWLAQKYNDADTTSINNYIDAAYIKGKKLIWKSLNKKQQVKLVALLVFSFLVLQLFWRILFEFLIAYMEMHDALLKLQL